MSKGRKSIFFNLTLSFIGLGLVPLLLAGTLLFVRFKVNMEQVVLEDMARMAGYAANNADEMVEECSSQTKRIYDIDAEDGRLLYELLLDRQMNRGERELQIRLLLNEMLDGDSRIRSAYFKEENGSLYYATRNTQKVLEEDAFLAWISQEGEMKESFSVLPTHRDDYFPGSENPVITFRRSYRDLTSFQTIGTSLGELYLDVDLRKLSSLLQDLDMGVNETFHIIDENGVCIYSPKEQEIGALLEDGDALIQQMEGTEGRFLEDGAYVVYERLERCGWSAVARADQAAVMKNLEGTRRYVYLFLGGTFFLLVCLYAFFLRRLRRPVEQLKEGMLKIQKGDLENRIDVGGREDEIGMLAEGLNDMAAELETYIKKVYVAEIRQREAELDALKSQIKPHYLYNTLEVIRMTALEHEDTEAARMVESLSKQLKYLIGYNSDRVPLKRELENIREYFYIMRIRYENRIELEVSAEPEALEASIIKLSLQPIVENAVRHGLRPKKEGGTVRIQAEVQGDCLELTVMDDGVGMDEETLERLNQSLEQEETGVRTEDGWEHVGLKNTCDRIRKNFGAEYGLQIMSTQGVGTIVICRLPFQTI